MTSKEIQNQIRTLRVALPGKEERDYLRYINRIRSGVQPCPRCGGCGRTWNPDRREGIPLMSCYRCHMTGKVTNPDIRLSPEWDPRYASDGPAVQPLPVPVMTVLDGVPDGRGGLTSRQVVARRFLTVQEAQDWSDANSGDGVYYGVPSEYLPQEDEPEEDTQEEEEDMLPF